MWRKLAYLLSKYPIKVILIAILAVIILAVGARNVQLATGNDTLVSSDTKVFKDNQQLEEEFGGESVIILYEGTDTGDLLTIDRLNHMKELENSLHTQEGIYSIISPVSLVEQMSDKQADKYKEGVAEVSDGLDQMGRKLIVIGKEIVTNASESSQLPNFGTNRAELNEGLGIMIKGQEKLKSGTVQLVNGYSQFGGQTKEAGLKLEALALQIESKDPQQEQQAEQIKKMSSQLLELSNKMIKVSEKSASLPNASEQTIKGLKGIENGLSKQQIQLGNMESEKEKQVIDLKVLGSGLMDMGAKLGSISENLTAMNDYSDTLKPGLPEKQETLNHMIYDENGELREIFDEVVINDQAMMMIVKFEANLDDSAKSEISNNIKSYLDENQLESTKMMVSGKPVLDDAIRSSMKESMQKMMMLSLLFMVIVLTFTFKVSWRLLSLGVVLVAVIGTVGLMGWIKIPITMVSMAVFPILIGLGIDYAIQFQNRYSEEMAEEEDLHDR